MAITFPDHQEPHMTDPFALLDKAQRRGDHWKFVAKEIEADRDRADKALTQAELRAKIAETELRTLRSGIRALGGDPTQVQNLWAQLHLRNRQWADAKRDVEAHRLALSEALGLGTGAPWDAIYDRATELGLPPLDEDPVARRLGLVPAPADRAAVLREAIDVAREEGHRLEAEAGIESARGARCVAYLLRKLLVKAQPDPSRLAAEAEPPLSPDYQHPECGFHWHGRDGMDIPMRDGQPVCPRCELRRVEKLLNHRERRCEELRAESKRRGKNVLEQSEKIIALEREIDGIRRQLGAEILRANQAEAALLPAWEVMYEPGNVSDYLIGYANDEAAAKGAAEAWLRSQKDEVGRLEWTPWGAATVMPDGYDRWFELSEDHGDGIPTGPGIVVRRRMADEAQPTTEARCTCADAGDAFVPLGHYADCPQADEAQQDGARP